MSDILCHVEAGVMTLSFHRLHKKNGITGAMYTALAEHFQQAAQDAALRVVVIQGHESVFSAGHDIADFLQMSPSSERMSDVAPDLAPDLASAPVFRFLHGLAAFPKPLLAAVCGPAVGIGATLLLHCDLVYAGDNAAFSMPFVNLGLCPEAASSLLLPQLLGDHRAAEVLLLGEPFTAETALEWGLINRILPPTEVTAYAQKVAKKLAAKPPEALMQTKRLLKHGRLAEVQKRIDAEGQVFAQLLGSAAAREALGAFLEGRPDAAKART